MTSAHGAGNEDMRHLSQSFPFFVVYILIISNAYFSGQGTTHKGLKLQEMCGHPLWRTSFVHQDFHQIGVLRNELPIPNN